MKKTTSKQSQKQKERNRDFFKQMFFVIFAEIIGIGGTLLVLILTSKFL